MAVSTVSPLDMRCNINPTLHDSGWLSNHHWTSFLFIFPSFHIGSLQNLAMWAAVLLFAAGLCTTGSAGADTARYRDGEVRKRRASDCRY